MEKQITEKQTDLQTIKTLAKGLLDIAVLETEYSPMIVSHPFTKSGLIIIPYDDDYFQLDITKNKQDLEKWKAVMSKQIDSCNDVYNIYHILNDAYRLMFFDYIANHLSKEDFSVLLGEAWVGSEYANDDANVTKKQMLAHFKNADKTAMMTESELETFEDLDDTMIIYRGVSSKQRTNAEALSWTISFGKAKWFAERWGKGHIYSAVVDKKDVYAYFDRKDEDEVVVDFSKLKNVKIVNGPQRLPAKTAPSME